MIRDKMFDGRTGENENISISCARRFSLYSISIIMFNNMTSKNDCGMGV